MLGMHDHVFSVRCVNVLAGLGFDFMNKRFQGSCGDLGLSAHYQLYGTQFDFTSSNFFGSAGSLVRRWTRNWWGPSMPVCIMYSRTISVVSPGLSVVEPTTALGGQQPSTTSTWGSSSTVSG